MNIFILILVGLFGIIAGVYFARKTSQVVRGGSNLNLSKRAKRKKEGKEKILETLQSADRITNDDVEKLLAVSDSTAERYLNELEKEGIIEQIGDTGKGVYYIPK